MAAKHATSTVPIIIATAIDRVRAGGVAASLARLGSNVTGLSIVQPEISASRPQVTKAWAKREAQVSAMIETTVGMVGDLHGIMGQAMPEIEAIEDPPMIEGKAA